MYGSSGEEISRFFADNSSRYMTSDFIIGIAFLVFYFPFLACFITLLRIAYGMNRPWPLLALIGGILFPMAGFAASAFNGPLALQEGNVSPEIAQTLAAATFYSFASVPLFAGVMTLGGALVILETRIFSRWLAWLGLAISVVGVVSSSATIANDPDGPLAALTFIVLPVIGMWVVGIAVSMIRMRAAVWAAGNRVHGG
ncbi:MAG: hypothetical protein ABIP13_03775 [Tepidiformaceae bacterium]